MCSRVASSSYCDGICDFHHDPPICSSSIDGSTAVGYVGQRHCGGGGGDLILAYLYITYIYLEKKTASQIELTEFESHGRLIAAGYGIGFFLNVYRCRPRLTKRFWHIIFAWVYFGVIHCTSL